MRRILKSDMGRFRAGSVLDLPVSTWDQMAAQLGLDLAKVTEALGPETAVKNAERMSAETRRFRRPFGRYVKGDERTYPVDIWQELAEEAGCKVDELAARVALA